MLLPDLLRLDRTKVRVYLAVVRATHSPLMIGTRQIWIESDEHVTPHLACRTSGARRGSIRSPVFAGTQADHGATVAEERFARTIAAAHAPDIACAYQAERYADAHWREYLGAARAVLDARA